LRFNIGLGSLYNLWELSPIVTIDRLTFLFLFFRCMIIYVIMIVTIIVIMPLDAVGYINCFFAKNSCSTK